MNKKTIYATTLILICCIVVVGVYFFLILNEEDSDEISEPIIQIDDRISPLTNQGLTVEILRIRHREILDEIFKIRYRWKDPPVSYWVTYVDGKECNSLGNIGYGSSGVYNEWDTMLKECRVNYKVEDEKTDSEVIIEIVTQEKAGLIFKKTNDVVKEKIRVNYDFKTGFWDGDDYLKDNDGYGHYLGENCEVWFNIYQSDYDHDNIPYWTEVNILDTDPMMDDSTLDPDNDGIPTSWEFRWGYNPHVWDDHEHLDPDIDGIENIEEYMMRDWFSNPYQPDIYIESDGMEKKNIFDLNHEFHDDSQQMIIERFAQHGINVYIDNGWPDGPINGGGEKLPFIDEIDEVVGGQILSFYTHHFDDGRKGIFRYVVIANKKGWNTPCQYDKYDTILVYSGRKLNIKNFIAVTPRLRSILLAKGVLHELGHSMGLMPYTFPGNDIMKPVGSRYPNMPEDEYRNYLEQYHSIMNYNFIYLDRKLFDYSDGSNGAPYDQNDWINIYLPSFQSDARAYEDPTYETFEDFEVLLDEIFPEIEGWNYDENLTNKFEDTLETLVYSDLKIDNTFQILITNESSDRNVKVYARPDIEPFPVTQSWTLVAEGKYDSINDDISFYSFDERLDNILELIN